MPTTYGSVSRPLMHTAGFENLDWVQVQATVLKSKSKYLDILQVQVQVQSLCYVFKSKSKYMSLYLSTSIHIN